LKPLELADVRPAVFLDRDGTMIEDVGYLSRQEDLHWYPWTIDAIRLLNRAGFLVCVTTNQGAVGLGFYDEDFVRSLHADMSKTLAAADARIDAWYFCPHYPTAVIDQYRVECDCRKPQPGMIRQAMTDFPIDLSRSFVVGDKTADVGMATAMGARAILVKTGYGEAELRRYDGDVPGVAFVAETLLEAVSWVLNEAGYPKERL
jgi:D-glycero-D-manno-heptose 1,7-bisphosphate phosphatase